MLCLRRFRPFALTAESAENAERNGLLWKQDAL